MNRSGVPGSGRIQKYGRVCIVSDDFLGLVVSSGAGTVMTTLAETLSNNGFDVTLLYTRGDYAAGRDLHCVCLHQNPSRHQ